MKKNNGKSCRVRENYKNNTCSGAPAANSWRIKRFAFWQANVWHNFDADEEPFLLKIVEDKLFIIGNGVIVETIKLVPATNIIAFHKEDDLYFKMKQDKFEKRYKIQFSCSKTEISACIMHLKKFIKVEGSVDHEAKQIKFMTRAEKVRDMLTKNPTEAFRAHDPLPRDYPLRDAVKICLMAPTFPDLVETVAKVMQIDSP